MFETLDLKAQLEKGDYKRQMDELDRELPVLQRAVFENRIPVIISFDGWYASGRGDAIGRLMHRFDPRGARVHVTHVSSEEDRLRPWMWRFWQRLPARGSIGIFDRSWYYLLWNQRFEEQIDAIAWERHLQEIDDFERQLVDDGTILIKFWLHISQKEQKRRLKSWSKDAVQRWRVSDEDWKRHEHYSERLELAEAMLARTHTAIAPWTLVEAEDDRNRRVQILRTVADTLRRKLTDRGIPAERLAPLPEEAPEESLPPGGLADDTLPEPLELGADSLLNRVDRTLDLEYEDYRSRLRDAQKRLRKLEFESYGKRLPVVVVFEGWDAAGKGGAIKRMTARLDPRGYHVIPIAAPSRDELARHYLWRFWTHLPKDGHWAVYDRSWYGRVLVERVEDLAPEEVWRRAYQEINEFEHALTLHGTVVVKFWLDISPEEQLERFRRREMSPIKRHKITNEDWRNRARWPAYHAAVSDMLRHTSTAHAPWTVVEADSKRWARVKVCEQLARAIEERG